MPSAALPLGLVKTSYWAIGREDHGLELAGFLLEHRFALGLGAEAAKAVLGFCGGDAHGGLPGCLAVLAIDDHGHKADPEGTPGAHPRSPEPIGKCSKGLEPVRNNPGGQKGIV
jgi:hypothetical protein